MKEIIFITSGKINYKFPNLSLYESIRETAMGNIFPKLDGKIVDKPKIIFDQLICASPGTDHMSLIILIFIPFGVSGSHR